MKSTRERIKLTTYWRMSKRYLNRDYFIFRQDKGDFADCTRVTEFNMKMFDKFIDLTRDEIFERFGFSLHDACKLILEKDYNIMFICSHDKNHVVIGREEKELIDFFKNNAPLDCYKELKVLKYMQGHAEYRERMKNDFDCYISVHYSSDYREVMERKKKRKEGLETLIGNE